VASLPITPAQRTLTSSALKLIGVGVDHRTAPIELRERVAYNPGQAEEMLSRLVATSEIAEACLLSTCNRTELYLKPHNEAAAYRTGLELVFLSRAPEIEEEGRFFVKRDLVAARHLLEVASGLQSMVLGEPEILGQVRQATGLAETVGASGTVLRKLLRTAVATGGRVRHETAIGSGAVSFGYAVVDLARNIFQHLDKCSVLILGAGETARQVARSLIERGAGELLVANRSPERAAAFLEVFPETHVVPFDERLEVLPRCDIVVASTGSSEPVLRAADVAAAMDRRKTRPLLLADLGVPRNVEAGAGEIGNVFLQDIDSLEDLISRNLKRRRQEVPRVQEILDYELAVFNEWHRGLAAEPVVALLQKRAEKIRRRELEAVRERLPAEVHDEVDRLTRSLVRKILHHPSHQLRRGNPLDAGKIGLVRALFQLDEDDEE